MDRAMGGPGACRAPPVGFAVGRKTTGLPDEPERGEGGEPLEPGWRIGVITFFRTIFPAKLGKLTASLPHHAAQRPSLVLL
jgi:hypothetical protein